MAVNPFGDDETDIDLQMLIESHIQVIHLRYLETVFRDVFNFFSCRTTEDLHVYMKQI